MSSITITSFENPQGASDGDFVNITGNITFPLILINGERNVYSEGNYSLLYDQSSNKIYLDSWGEIALAWLNTVTYSFGTSPSPNSYTNTYYVTWDEYDRDDARATYFKTAASELIEGGGGGGNAVCFLGSAPVLTPAGYKRIDSLAAGDMVCTADGRDVAIQRVKHQRILAPSTSVNPYIIPAGQFGATENLAISPRHCVAVPGRGMIEARDLGLRQMSMRAAFDYYNLELPEWDNMVVAGVEVESLAPKKRVVMTAAEFRGLVGGRSVDMAKLARFATVLEDGRVGVALTRKARRM